MNRGRDIGPFLRRILRMSFLSQLRFVTNWRQKHMSVVNNIYRYVRLDNMDNWMMKPTPQPPSSLPGSRLATSSSNVTSAGHIAPGLSTASDAVGSHSTLAMHQVGTCVMSKQPRSQEQQQTMNLCSHACFPGTCEAL